MVFSLIYTATFVPFRTSFIDESSAGFVLIETGIDAFFILDLVFNFFSAYID